MSGSDSTKLRVLAVYNMILRGDKITASQILRELECRYDIRADRKTIYSDIYAIDRIQPIEVSAGRYGGYRKLDVLGRCEDG